jgi:hypothetical protein
MNAESPKNFAATDERIRPVRATETGRGNAAVAKPKKNIKPRLATQRRERSGIAVNYAVRSETGHMTLAGW